MKRIFSLVIVVLLVVCSNVEAMYIVINKETKDIIHKNYAPLYQELDNKEVYYNYDSNSMDIIKYSASVLPEHRVIDGEFYREMTDTEKILKAIIPVPEDMLLEDGVLRDKTDEEKIIEGLIALPSGWVIIDGEVREMTEQEKIDVGLI